MRVATWNVNGLRARLDFVLHWLRAREPDAVGMQELKLTDAQFPYADFEKAGYRAAVHGQKGWNGVAVLVKESLADGVPAASQVGLPGQDDLGARLITVPVGDLDFTTIYVPNGKHLGHEDYPRKLAWLDALATHLETARAAERPAVVCGDFNIVPTALDSWNEAELAGEIFHTEEERMRFKRLLGLGFVDAFRALRPDDQAFSWWDYRGGAFHRKRGLRIDFVLLSRVSAARAQAVEIDRDWRKKVEGLTPSDHAPVVVELGA